MYNAEDVVERLTRKFGMGANPTLRLALYHRLGALVEAEGDVAYFILSETVADAVSKTDPAKFFCKIVLKRLIERGVLKPRDW